jgi:hypothetical protein
MPVVAASHDYVQTGDLGDPPKLGWISADFIRGAVHDSATTRILEPTEFLYGKLGFVQDSVDALFTEKVNKDMLVRQRNAEFIGADWPENGVNKRHALNLACRRDWRISFGRRRH